MGKTQKALFLILSVIAPLTYGQLHLANDNPIVYGHHHINTLNPEAHKRFWIDGLGGTTTLVGDAELEIIEFPNLQVFLTEREPSGGTRGTVVNHVGFETTDIVAAVSRLQEMGYSMITREELPERFPVEAGIASVNGATLAFVQGPDDIKVELIENTSNPYPIQLHHVHWAVEDGNAVQAWYVENLGAAAGSRIGQPAGDFPGVNLTFGPTPISTSPIRGSVLDHIGFEVKNLKAFCEELKAKGVDLDMDYREIPSLGIAVAFLTDPWGTYIELTEGLSPQN